MPSTLCRHERLLALSLLLFLLLLGCAALAPAQEVPQVLRAVVFSIEGGTGESAVREFTGLREGRVFPSALALAHYLDETRRALVNDRVFKSVELTDEGGELVDGRVEHRVTLRLVDTPTFVPLPNISYNSNYGLLLGAQINYDNAFGSMSNWFFNSYVALRDEEGRYIVGLWELHPRVSALMIGGLAWKLDLKLRRESLDLWDRGIEAAAWEDFYGSASIDTRLPLGASWYYELRPGFAGQFGTVDLRHNGANPGDFAGPNYRQALGIDKVDWVGGANFRSGYELRLEHLIQGQMATGNVANEISATALWCLPWSFLDYYGRARIQADYGTTPVNLGKYLRGIADNSMSGTASVFLNQTLGIDLGLPRRVVDIQLHPFLDLGTALSAGRAWDPQTDIRRSVGCDIIFLADSLANLAIRFTLGFDLGASDPLAAPEIVMDTALSY